MCGNVAGAERPSYSASASLAYVCPPTWSGAGTTKCAKSRPTAPPGELVERGVAGDQAAGALGVSGVAAVQVARTGVERCGMGHA